MSDAVLTAVAGVLARVEQGEPADRVLRAELRTARGLTRSDSRFVSRVVFAHERWRGWLDRSQPLRDRVEAALDRARAFRRDPESIGEAELRQRAIPAWIADEMDVSVEWLRALQSEPPVWLRARPGEGEALAARLEHCRAAGAGMLADTLQYTGSLDLFRTPEFAEGKFEIQDLHSQAVGWMCAARPGETWWDACAGEGGKTLHLADAMANRGLIWATDRAEWRLEQLKRRAARAGLFNYRMRVWDGGASLPTKSRFDGILVDAPCTNWGTWHRNPHARWTARREDVVELASIQLQLLRHAAGALKPGGRLVYAVCTLSRAETAGVTAAFSAASPELEPMTLAGPLDSARNGDGGVWLDCQPGGGNGMYVSAWRRRESPLAKGNTPPL